jgi:hypothetical protein
MDKSNPMPVINCAGSVNSQLTRREMVQRLLVGAGAGAAWPLVAAAHPIYAHLASGAVFEEVEKLGALDWKPLFLDAQQTESLAALAEAIVTRSGNAQVDRFIDLLLSVETAKHRNGFAESLAAFEAESQRQFSRRFPSLDASQQNALLTAAAARPSKEDSPGGGPKQNSELHAHFENLKGWISGAYYSSEAGMRELGWTGEFVFESFPGCAHPEEHK